MSTFRKIEHEILSCLCWNVAAATTGQLIRAYSAPDVPAVSIERLLRRLNGRQFIERISASLIVVELASPLTTWQPGRPRANFHRVAWQLEKRWKFRPQQHFVCWATRKASLIFGGVASGLRQPFQLQHDLGTTAVYFHLRSSLPSGIRWISEDCYRRHFQPPRKEKIADAVLLNETNEIVTAIEFGGQYDAARLGSFHRYWSRRRIPYQIW